MKFKEEKLEEGKKISTEYKTQQDVCGNGNMVWQRFTLEIK